MGGILGGIGNIIQLNVTLQTKEKLKNLKSLQLKFNRLLGNINLKSKE